MSRTLEELHAAKWDGKPMSLEEFEWMTACDEAFARMDALAATGDDTPEYRESWEAWIRALNERPMRKEPSDD